MKHVRLVLPLSLVAALGTPRAEAQCYDTRLNGASLSQPHVAASADGRMVVVWTDGTDRVTAVAADGTPGGTYDLPPNELPLDRQTALASGPESHLLVTARYNRSIRALAIGADGTTPTGSWMTVADLPAQDLPMPDVIWDEDSFLLAWTVEVPQPGSTRDWQMRVARVDASGVALVEAFDVPGAVTGGPPPQVRIVRTGSVLWLLWSATSGMRLAPADLTPLDAEPVRLFNAASLLDAAVQGDEALVLVRGNQIGADVAVFVDENGVRSVETAPELPPIDDSKHIELFALPGGGYQMLEASVYGSETFPAYSIGYQMVELDAAGRLIETPPVEVRGQTPSGTASARGSLLVWVADEGSEESGTSRIRLRLPQGTVVNAVEKRMFTETFEVPCPPPGDDHPCGGNTDDGCIDVGCSAGRGKAGLAAVGLLLVSAVVATRRRRR